MAKHRSPNCPQISFAEAIEKGRKVYVKETTHPAAKVVIATDLGYAGLNGRSLPLLGALRQYGILEGSGDALRISKDALAYFEMDDGPERQEAIRRMVFSPAVFAQLHEDFKGTLPSEGNLKHQLITKGFLPKAADDVIKVYKANVALVSGEEQDYSGAEGEPPMSTEIQIPQPTPPPQKPVPGVQAYAFALSPEARAELVLRGSLSKEDLNLLRDHIDLTIRALGGNTRKPEAERKQ